jgi:hypothetical protein
LPDEVRKLSWSQTLGQRSLNGCPSLWSTEQIGSLIARSRHNSSQQRCELFTLKYMIANGPLTIGYTNVRNSRERKQHAHPSERHLYRLQ